MTGLVPVIHVEGAWGATTWIPATGALLSG